MLIIQDQREPDKFLIQFSYGEMRELQNMTDNPNGNITETLLRLILNQLEENAAWGAL